MTLKFHLTILFAFLLGRTASASCPPNEKISLCTCQSVLEDAYVTCTDLQNLEEMKSVIDGVKGLRIYSLVFKQSNLGDIPGDIFKGTHIEVLKFMHSRMTSLGDNENPPFTGLENILKRLTLTEAFWNYDKPLEKPVQLHHLNKLVYLEMENNVIPTMGDDWFQKGPKRLRELFITTALVKTVGDNCFSSLTKLRTLHFTGNSVMPPTSAFPAGAPIEDLDLSDNRIKEMPAELLNSLKSLKNLYLSSNAIETLPEATWSKILRQLDVCFLNSNPLKCDSKMKWIVEQQLNTKIVGECASPPSLSTRPIDSLKAEELSD